MFWFLVFVFYFVFVLVFKFSINSFFFKGLQNLGKLGKLKMTGFHAKHFVKGCSQFHEFEAPKHTEHPQRTHNSTQNTHSIDFGEISFASAKNPKSKVVPLDFQKRAPKRSFLQNQLAECSVGGVNVLRGVVGYLWVLCGC